MEAEGRLIRMSHVPRVALLACALLAAAELSLLLLLRATQDSPIVFPGVLASSALICLILMARSMVRHEFGSAVAWGYSGIPIIASLLIFELPLVHLSRLLGTPQCDAMAVSCDPATLPFWMPFLLTIAAMGVAWVAVRRCKRVVQTASR